MENFKSFSEAIQPGSVPEPGREAVGGRFKSAAPKKPTKPAPFVTSEDTKVDVQSFSDFLEGRCWPGYKPKPGKTPYSPGSCVKESPDAELKEDLRKWFSKTDPKGGWKRINSKGEAIGPCAREPGEPKPKCMSNEKRAALSKKERASAVAAKRKHDPNPERKGAPINVSNFGKGKISEDMENLEEKNVPTSPEKWAQAKAQAKAKFDVYPSAYANGWASKKYKEMGGGWKSVAEETENLEEGRPSQRHPLEGHEYHKKSDEALIHIAKDAHAAAEAMKSHNTTAENKYRDQANDSATVRHFRKTSGMPDWYKKKYGHMKEDAKQDDKSSTALSGLVAKKNLKQAEGKNKSQEFINKMTSKVNAAKRLKEEDAYDKDAKPSDKPHDKEAAAKRAKIAAVMARRKMAKEEVEQLDELSPSTLQSYKVAGHKKYDSIRNNTDADSMTKKSKLEKGIKTAHAKQYPSKPAAAAPKKDPNSRGYEQGRYMGDSVEQDNENRIDELSNDMLGRYKTAAGADASKADKAGDYNKGNKRFSGIMRATKKQMANDIVTRASAVTEAAVVTDKDKIVSVHDKKGSSLRVLASNLGHYRDAGYKAVREAKEKTEYDYEGDMARGQLQSVINNAQRVHDMLEDNDNLPEWVQSKITLAEDYISTVANYMMSEIDESIADDKYGSAASETLVTKPYKEPAKKMQESKDDSPPFDGPYVKRTGTVTDKSGAKHTDMSRVRDLARTAMKKQASSYKAPKKLGEEASRKAEIVKTAAKKKKPDSKEDTFQAEPELSSTITKNY